MFILLPSDVCMVFPADQGKRTNSHFFKRLNTSSINAPLNHLAPKRFDLLVVEIYDIYPSCIFFYVNVSTFAV